MWACFARPKASQHSLEFTTTPCQNSPSYSKHGKGVVTHPVTHLEIFPHTLSVQMIVKKNKSAIAGTQLQIFFLVIIIPVKTQKASTALKRLGWNCVRKYLFKKMKRLQCNYGVIFQVLCVIQGVERQGQWYWCNMYIDPSGVCYNSLQLWTKGSGEGGHKET